MHPQKRPEFQVGPGLLASLARWPWYDATGVPTARAQFEAVAGCLEVAVPLGCLGGLYIAGVIWFFGK